MTTDLKIIIPCKQGGVNIPSLECFYPVTVGSVSQGSSSDMLPGDLGENISAKAATYGYATALGNYCL